MSNMDTFQGTLDCCLHKLHLGDHSHTIQNTSNCRENRGKKVKTSNAIADVSGLVTAQSKIKVSLFGKGLVSGINDKEAQ